MSFPALRLLDIWIHLCAYFYSSVESSIGCMIVGILNSLHCIEIIYILSIQYNQINMIHDVILLLLNEIVHTDMR